MTWVREPVTEKHQFTHVLSAVITQQRWLTFSISYAQQHRPYTTVEPVFSRLNYRASSRVVGKLISGVCDFVCLCASVRALKVKWLELSMLNLVHVYCMTVARHALTCRSKGQRSRSHGYENRHGRMAAVAVLLLLQPAWDCTSYDCLGF